jgi:hypothetical protein
VEVSTHMKTHLVATVAAGLGDLNAMTANEFGAFSAKATELSRLLDKPVDPNEITIGSAGKVVKAIEEAIVDLAETLDTRPAPNASLNELKAYHALCTETIAKLQHVLDIATDQGPSPVLRSALERVELLIVNSGVNFGQRPREILREKSGGPNLDFIRDHFHDWVSNCVSREYGETGRNTRLGNTSFGYLLGALEVAGVIRQEQHLSAPAINGLPSNAKSLIRSARMKIILSNQSSVTPDDSATAALPS